MQGLLSGDLASLLLYLGDLGRLDALGGLCDLRHALVGLLQLFSTLIDGLGLGSNDKMRHMKLLSVLVGLAEGSNAKHRFGRGHMGRLPDS